MMQVKSTATIQAEAEPEIGAPASVPAPNGAAHVLVDHLTEEQLAEEWHIGLRTMRRYRALRQSPPYVKIGRKVYYRRRAIEEWLRGRERGFEEPQGRARRSPGR
jgi:hypothetical protein